MMKREEIREAISVTQQQIDQINEQLDRTGDVQEKRRLLKELKDLHYLQFWQREQLEHLGDG